MKLLELFIIETTEEDRAIISLSSTIYRHLQKYADYIDPSSTDPLNTGKIDDFCTTPLEGMGDISIFLMQGDSLREKVKKDNNNPENIDSKGKVILGVWYNDIPGIFLNSDYITSNAIKSTITHELRHALDDLKSGGRASLSTKYSSPKKKEYRKKDPDTGEDNSYIARPEEINARFAQVLHSLTLQIERMSHLPPDQLWQKSLLALKQSMNVYKISKLFPEKEKSSDYKRLMKRAADFIKKEINYLSKESF